MVAKLVVAVFITLAACASGRVRSKNATLLAVKRRTVSQNSGVPQCARDLSDSVATIKEHREKSIALSKQRSQTCTASKASLKDSVAQLTRDKTEAETDLATLEAEETGLKADIKTTRVKITTLGEDIDSLVAELDVLRNKMKSQRLADVTKLQEVEKLEDRIGNVEAQSCPKTWDGGCLNGDELGLKKYVDQGYTVSTCRAKCEAHADCRAFTLSNEDSHYCNLVKDGCIKSNAQRSFYRLSTCPRTASQALAPSFLQRHASHQGLTRKGHAVSVDRIEEAKKEFKEAAVAAKKDLDEQESALLEGLKLKRKELKKEEETLRPLLPALADKLKQIAETGRVLSSATRGLARDESVITVLDKKCSELHSIFIVEKNARQKLETMLKMAKGLVETIDTETFLLQDMDNMPVASKAPDQVPQAPAFVQVAAVTQHSRHPRRTLLQEGMDLNLTSAGPFDEVTQTIEALVASLTNQGNADVDNHQFCMDNIAKNKRTIIEKNAEIDMKMLEIRWAEEAVAGLDENIEFLGNEQSRLEAAVAAATQELKEERERREKEATDLTTVKGAIERCQATLQDSCNVSPQDNALSTSPAEIASSSSDRTSPCEVASDLSQNATTQLASMDSTMADNLIEITTLLEKESSAATAAKADTDQVRSQAVSDKSERANEVVTGNSELETLRNAFKELEMEQRDLATTCGPKVEPHEARQQRMTDEIDALKNALDVLNGESVPV